MKHYAVIEINVTDQSWMPAYLANVTMIVRKYEGRFLSRTVSIEKIEGERPLSNAMVILEFPSRKAALDFYNDPEYQPYKAQRQSGSQSEFVMLPGEDIAAS